LRNFLYSTCSSPECPETSRTTDFLFLNIADNLKRQGGFIPGIRTGEATKEFLNETASRLTVTGALYLGLVATLPFMIIKGLGVPFFFGGTAVLIVVQVALDTMRKIEAQVYMSKYETLSAVGL